MARIRTIKPEFPQSESMGRVSRESRLCFVLLWTIADDAGRLRGNSRMLASLLYPYDDDAKNKIDGWLGQLASERCIIRYEVESAAYIQVLNWTSHQKIDKPSASRLPPFVEASRILANPLEGSSGDLGPRKGGDLGLEGTDSGVPALAATPPAPAIVEPTDPTPPEPTPQPVLTLTLIDGSEHPITEAEVSEWSQAYPGVNVLQQLREMRSWCTANKSNRKTKRGIGAFVVRWLGGEQDKSGWDRQRQGASRACGETAYARNMREKYEVIAPSVAARNPNLRSEVNPTDHFELLIDHKLEIGHAA